MKNVSLHKLKKIIIKAILSLFAVYIIYSISVSIELYIIVNVAFSDKKYDGIVTSYISEEEYNILNPKDSELEENKDIRRDCFVTFPLVLPFFIGCFQFSVLLKSNRSITCLSVVTILPADRYTCSAFYFRSSNNDLVNL